MKKVLVPVICLLLQNSSISQNFSFSLPRQFQAAYLGFKNPLSCTVDGLLCKSIILSTDNGIIEKTLGCNYIYSPSKIGDTKISISQKINNKLKKVGEFFVQVRNFPDPIAFVGGMSGGIISKGALNAQEGVGAYPPVNLGFELNYQVKSFFITAIRNKELLFFKSVEGPSFTADVHKLFDILEKNDIVIFSGITVLKTDGRDVKANGLEFNIE